MSPSKVDILLGRAASGLRPPTDFRARTASLFAGLRGQGAETSLDVQTAVMIPIVAAMLADGRVEEEEVLQIETICATSPIFDRNSIAENERLIVSVTRMIQDQGIEKACRSAAAMLTPALKETAFIYAVRMIFSDGYIGELEREVIDSLLSVLEIAEERGRILIEVVSVMQHPVTA